MTNSEPIFRYITFTFNHLLPAVYMGDVKGPSRLTKQIMWMYHPHNTCWTEEKQHLTVCFAWMHPSFWLLQKQRGYNAGVWSSACLFYLTAICVRLYGFDVCPTCTPLSRCVFCNTRKRLSELSHDSGGNRFSWARTTGWPFLTSF